MVGAQVAVTIPELHIRCFKGAILHVIAGALFHLLKKSGVVHQFENGFEEGISISCRHNKACLAVNKVFFWASLIRHDNGQTRGLGLQNNIAKGVGGGRKKTKISAET